MARPSWIAIAVPQSQFPGFSINSKDFRFNFVINNGSKNMPTCVPIYKAETLDDQLDEVQFNLLTSIILYNIISFEFIDDFLNAF